MFKVADLRIPQILDFKDFEYSNFPILVLAS